MRNLSFKILATVLFVTFFGGVQAGNYFKSDRLIFDFYTPFWLNTPNDISTDPSFGFSVAWGKDLPFKRNSKFSFFSGLGYDISNIHHNANLKSQNESSTRNQTGLYALTSNFGLNKLSTHFIEVPVEFRFRTQTKNPFRFYIGGKVGYMLYSKYQLDENNGNIYERKMLNELSDLKYGVTVRVGYGLVNLYTYYGLNGLMNPSDQKGVNQLAIGLSFIAN